MTLSRVLASLTGRQPEPPRRTAAADSSPAVASAILRSDRLRFLPASSEPSLGPTHEVRERIAEILPGVAFDEEGRGAFTRTGYSIAFETGAEDHVRTVAVRVDGGRAAVPPLARLIAKTGWRLVIDEPAQTR